MFNLDAFLCFFFFWFRIGCLFSIQLQIEGGTRLLNLLNYLDGCWWHELSEINGSSNVVRNCIVTSDTKYRHLLILRRNQQSEQLQLRQRPVSSNSACVCASEERLNYVCSDEYNCPQLWLFISNVPESMRFW